jgi:hypothetical protein
MGSQRVYIIVRGELGHIPNIAPLSWLQPVPRFTSATAARRPTRMAPFRDDFSADDGRGSFDDDSE